MENKLDGNAAARVDDRIANDLEEAGVGEQLAIIAEPDEAGRAACHLVVETEPDRIAERVDDGKGDDREGRKQEQQGHGALIVQKSRAQPDMRRRPIRGCDRGNAP